MAKKRKTKKFDAGGVAEAKPAWMTEDERGIEPVYPVEEAVLGKIGSKLLKPVGQYIAKEADLLTRPKVVNRLYNDKIGGPEYAAGDVSKKYGVRNVFSPQELEDIKSSGYMRPRQAMGTGKQPKQSKYFTMTDEPKGQTIRVPSDKIPKGRAVRREDVEVFNKQTGEYEPLKKGGSVKSKKNLASSRGDGCVQRGKTKGRFV